MRKTIRNVLSGALAAYVAFSGASFAPTAHAGEGFFEKIGDGWRNGKWVPGLPDVKPQTWQEVVFPICWGSPQDCRGEAEKTASRPGQPPPPLYSARSVLIASIETTGVTGAIPLAPTLPASLWRTRGRQR